MFTQINCRQCGTSIYLNEMDVTHQANGSWYEVQTRQIHDKKKCIEAQTRQMKKGGKNKR